MSDAGITRRHALRLLVFAAPCTVVGCSALEWFSATGRTPTCVFTVDNPAGPFYLADAPLTQVIAPTGAPGRVLHIAGQVTGGADCAPLPGALVEAWQANPQGEYDMSGQFLYRGRILADGAGRYTFETRFPGNYGVRPAHIHLRISHPAAPTLITQLYFEGDPANAWDSLVRPSLIIPLDDADDGALRGVFDIALGA